MYFSEDIGKCFYISLSCVEGKTHKFELERSYICKGVHTWVQLNHLTLLNGIHSPEYLLLNDSQHRGLEIELEILLFWMKSIGDQVNVEPHPLHLGCGSITNAMK